MLTDNLSLRGFPPEIKDNQLKALIPGDLKMTREVTEEQSIVSCHLKQIGQLEMFEKSTSRETNVKLLCNGVFASFGRQKLHNSRRTLILHENCRHWNPGFPEVKEIRGNYLTMNIESNSS